MDIQKVLKENKVWITGELIEYDLSIKVDREQNEYISGQVIVKSMINGEEQLIPIDFFSRAKTQAGTPNKLYASYVDLENRVGKRISVQGEIQENRFYQESSGQVISYNRVSGRFINDVRSNQEDRADFTFTGYVVAPITERQNKDGEVLFHEITLAEANYNGEFPIYVKFVVRGERAVSYMISAYEKGTTVKVNGRYEIETSSEERTEETAFGEPIKRTYTSTFKNFVITSGTEPIEQKSYEPQDIVELDKAYEERGLDIESRAREVTVAEDTPTAKRGLGKALL